MKDHFLGVVQNPLHCMLTTVTRNCVNAIAMLPQERVPCTIAVVIEQNTLPLLK